MYHDGALFPAQNKTCTHAAREKNTFGDVGAIFPVPWAPLRGALFTRLRICEAWCMWLQMDGEAVGSRW